MKLPVIKPPQGVANTSQHLTYTCYLLHHPRHRSNTFHSLQCNLSLYPYWQSSYKCISHQVHFRSKRQKAHLPPKREVLCILGTVSGLFFFILVCLLWYPSMWLGHPFLQHTWMSSILQLYKLPLYTCHWPDSSLHITWAGSHDTPILTSFVWKEKRESMCYLARKGGRQYTLSTCSPHYHSHTN